MASEPKQQKLPDWDKLLEDAQKKGVEVIKDHRTGRVIVKAVKRPPEKK